jgi:hypothetical protein
MVLGAIIKCPPKVIDFPANRFIWNKVEPELFETWSV